METEGREPLDAEKRACVQQVLNRFPDISLEFVASVVGPLDYKAEQVINHVFERQNSGEAYPKEQTEVISTLKEGSTEGMNGWIQKQREYTDPNRPAESPGSPGFELTQTMLAGDFPYVPMKSLVEILSNNKNHLYPAYIATLEIAANNMFHGAPLPWTPKKYPSPLNKRYEDKTLFVTLRSTQDATEGYLIPELALSRLVKGQQSLRLSTISIRRRDALSLQQAMASAQVSECEGCFAEYPLNYLIHCDGEQPHLFCSNCCATNAETQIAQSKHELQCMSIEDCSAGFSVGERAKFLSVDHIKALDRIEKDAQGVQQQNYQQQ
ncbi:hypothetical protein B0J15DRAFT_540184 [Fusarium solani]|uniref:Uncharacterized protein n=1 Tax=Fusarium solani TaxID=169388 RepID=A0A9P9L6Y7_FUSSL|nr:uncharacterized protein B0J15DRAFT_540184 [Fusarium solani]KAH7275141.1 hypothetical protein B0J15DRAFT_540184 [Fusarium solani]